MAGNEESVISSDQKVSSLCNPQGLPHDGVVEKGDFVCWPNGSGLVYFMKPKNPNQTPMSSHDGEPKFVKTMPSIRCFGERTLGGYLELLAEKHKMAVRRVNVKNPVEEIWHFC